MTPPAWLRRFAVACLTLLVVLLPVSVAARGITAAPTPAELHRLERATAVPPAPGSEVARQFLVAGVAGLPLPTTAGAEAPFVQRARLMQLLAIAGVSVGVYLAMLLARGRLHALLACAALALLPAVHTRGHELRPEGAAALFLALGLVLTTCFAADAARTRRPGARRRWWSLAGLSSCACLANALAVAALPTTGECLLVPGGVLLLGTLQLSLRARRAARRHGWLGIPIRAINGRLLPWTATSLLMPAVALWSLSQTVAGPAEAVLPSLGGSLVQEAGGTLPLLLMGFGAGVGLLRVGLRLGRRGRLGPDLALFVFAAAFVAGLWRADGEDGLPAAAALAALAGEGLASLLVLAQGLLSARRGRTARLDRLVGPPS
ncbi:MAG: hypothetical protein IT455_21330 [Planctomycetes bacterium]|nr:hypothetical protein [Planctomycetota bacterium]